MNVPSFLSRITLIPILFFGFIYNSSAQTDMYKLGGADPVILQALAEKHEKMFRQTLTRLPSQHKKEFEQLYKQRWENAKSKFEKREVYTSPAASEYLNALAAEIISNNPQLSNIPINCYFSRSGAPNASYIGEGIILFNMGLFYRLENESQAAFVICHEIAHLFLQHSEKTISNYVTNVNSEEVQKQLKKIKGSQYGKSQPLELLVKSITFDSRRHVRENESAADSMAVELLKNTKFNLSETLKTLAILDSIDSDTINTNECLRKMFNPKSYPFQEKWIAKEEGLLGGHAKLEADKFEDSLKTHPDCKLRISRLEPTLSMYNRPGQKNVIDSAKFRHLAKLFRYEIIDYAYSSGNYSRSLYYTMEFIREKPSDPYLVSNTGRLLNAIYFAQKEHRLSKFVDLPAPAYAPHYNQLLQFVQNLYLENIASISYHYLDRFQQKLNDYQPFKDAYNASIQIAQK